MQVSKFILNVQALKNISFLKFLDFDSNSSEEKAQLIFSDNYTQYTLLNIPISFVAQDIINLFSININQIQRIFNNKLNWIIISEDEDFNKSFENTMRSVKINGVS